MRVIKFLLITFIIIIFSSCKTIHPTNKDRIWYNYDSIKCLNKPIEHWPWAENDWQLHYKNYLYYIPVEYGYVVLKNNDTIYGLISFYKVSISNIRLIILPRGDVARSTSLFFLESKKDCQIKKFRIYYDSSNIHTNCYADYFNLYDQYQLKNYWRLVDKNMSFEIYDNFKYSNSYNNNNRKATLSKMILVDGSKSQILYKTGLFRTIQGSLIRFINKQSINKVHKTDFKSIKEIIHYLLNEQFKNFSK